LTKFRTARATLKDLDVLVEQRDKMFEEMGIGTSRERKIASDAYRSWARRRMQSGKLVCFITKTQGDGRAVAGGCVWLREIQPTPGHSRGPIPYLLSMYTEPRFRGKGLATTIIERAIRWSREGGHSRMTLHASRMGRRVYSKVGWERTWEMSADLKGAPPKPRGKRRA
jgi:GNAT superfamily N-acetyltransferase